MGEKKKQPRGLVSDEIYREQVQASAAVAFEKRKAGSSLSLTDLAAIRRWEEYRAEESFLTFARACPQKWLLQLLDTHKKVLREWERLGMPRNSDRKKSYDLFKVLAWVKERWLQIKAGGDSARAGVDARARKDAAKAELAEVELLRVLGALVYADDVKAEVQRMQTRVRNELLSVPGRVSALCEGKGPLEIQRVVDEAIRGALAGLGEGQGQEQTHSTTEDAEDR